MNKSFRTLSFVAVLVLIVILLGAQAISIFREAIAPPSLLYHL